MESQKLYAYEHEKVKLDKRGWTKKVISTYDGLETGEKLYLLLVECPEECLDELYDILRIPAV
jgi:hypothetical protein